MKTTLVTIGIVIAAAAGAMQAVVSLESSYVLPADDPAIKYRGHGDRNPVARLQEGIAAGELRLGYDKAAGYLPALLNALKVPVSSQVLVFSKTSFQATRIYPHNPRAIYFNDSVAIGHVPGSDLLEITATDPDAGVVFFTLDQTEAGTPAITRRSDECLSCHVVPRTLGVPGLVVRSVHPSRTGMPIFRAGSFFTDHRSPLEQRWGGWYVTGKHGSAQHMGNRFAIDDDGTLEPAGSADVLTLNRFFDTSRHLAPYSDLVALMVLEHQVRLTNLITRVGWETKLALSDHARHVTELKEPDVWSDATRRRIEQPAEVLLRSLLMIDESPLPGPVSGTSSFAHDYSARGPRDSRHRSLYELNLDRRLYRYRCSPLVYSEQFAGLPREVRDYVYRRMVEVLDGTDRSDAFAVLTNDERKAALDILRETLPDLRR